MLRIFAIGALFANLLMYSQEKITINVLDNLYGKPIKNVDVYSSNGELLGTSSVKGKLDLSIKIDTTLLTFFKDGFYVKELKLTRNYTNPINVKLTPLSEILSEVEIRANKRKVFALKQLKKVQGTAIYAGKKSEVILLSEVLANTATNNPRQIYAQVVGLNIYENDDAGLQLNIGGRGLDPNRTANFNTRQNNYDISADVLGYPESYYAPPADALDEIQVVRGAASLQYGTQFGGLLNFKFKKPSKKEIDFVSRQSLGSYNLFNSFNSLSGTVNKTEYYTFINYKNGDGFRPNSNFNSFNFFGTLTHHFSNKTSLSFDVTYLDYLAKQAGGLTDTQFKKDIFFSNRNRNWFAVNWNLWAVKFKHDFSQKTKFTFDLFGLQASRKALGFRTIPLTYPDIIEDNVYVNNRDLIVGNYRNWGLETRFLSEYKLWNQSHTYLLGLKYYKASNSEQQGEGSKNSDADFKFTVKENELGSNFTFPNENVAFFSENIFNLSENFSITPGFRAEYIKTEGKGIYKNVLLDGAGNPILGGITYNSDNRIKERYFGLLGLGLSYQYTNYLELYANISQNYRSVTFNDIRTVSPSFIVDENITDEKGGTADIGIRGKFKKYFSYDLGGFALFYNNRIGEVIEDQGKNKGDRVRTNIGDAVIYGFEGLTTFDLSKLLGIQDKDFYFTNFVNLAITNSEYIKSIKPNVEGNKVEFIPNINLKTGMKIGYKNFMSNFQFTYLSKQYTEATNAQPDSKGELREGLVGEIPQYSILDASFSYKFKNWKIETGVNNLLDSRYFTRRATGYPGPGIIPAAPISWFGTIELTF